MRKRQAHGRKETLKGIIERLHAGDDPEALKAEFREFLVGVSATDIARLEADLVKEGLPCEELQGLCEIHMALFRESLGAEAPRVPAWHPVFILMEEHQEMRAAAEKLEAFTRDLAQGKTPPGAEIAHLVHHLKASEIHYVREENVLFPHLERHGITEPPAVMWMEHDRIRAIKKDLFALLDGEPVAPGSEQAVRAETAAASLLSTATSHFEKENQILFPAGLAALPENEWFAVRAEFDQLGYCCFAPEAPPPPQGAVPSAATADERTIPLPSGTLAFREVEALLNGLPIDITFVGPDDTVRYFSQGKDRIFPRSPAIIGRTVQACHPQKSVHIVQRILDDFKAGTRESAAFWIDLGGRLIYVRYFPVRDAAGTYLGCLEVSQDITDLRRIEGERRLLDDTSG